MTQVQVSCDIWITSYREIEYLLRLPLLGLTLACGGVLVIAPVKAEASFTVWMCQALGFCCWQGAKMDSGTSGHNPYISFCT